MASLTPRHSSEEETEAIRCDKDKLDEHVGPTPWSKQAMAGDQLWIDKVSEQQAVDIGQERLVMAVDAYEEERGEQSAHRYRIHLDGIEDHAQ